MTSFSRREALRLISGCALAPLLAGCGPARKLRIASHVWPGYELMFLARSLGWLDERRASLLETASATASMQAIADGRADGAALTLDEVLRVRADGVPLSVVLVFDISAGADVLLARPGIESLAGLKGRRIGFEQGAVGTLMLDHALREAGLAAGEVVQVPLPFDRHEAAWREGALDALITFEPVAGRLVGAGARADPELAAVFLRSLLHNAWKFTGRTPGARIEFGATGMDGERAFFVADNGAGFDPAHAKRLFKPFFKLHAPGEFPGVGIGTAIVRRIVQRHGGRIWATAAPGQGATFFFTLSAETPGLKVGE